MDPRATKWLGKVITVRGPIPADELGVTLPHEHILIRHQGPLVDTVDPILASEELRSFARFGGRTVVDMTNVGLQRERGGAQAGVGANVGPHRDGHGLL